jgi:uncharacterized protein
LITTANLKTQSWKDLAELAKHKGLAGYSSMKKDELVRALMRAAAAKKRARERAAASRPAKSKSTSPKSVGIKSSSRPVAVKLSSAKPLRGGANVKTHAAHTNGAKVRMNGAKPHTARPHTAKPHTVKPQSERANGSHAKPPAKPSAKQLRIAERIQRASAERERLKDLSGSFSVAKSGGKRKAAEKDRLVLMVRDPYWLQACWSVTRHTVKRAEAALAEHWHTAHPVLRLLEVDGGSTTSTSERVAREIDVHGGVTNWYIEVSNPPQSFRCELGYKSASGRFFSICRSNTVNTPAPDSSDVIDENWTDVAENYERVYAMSGGYSEDNNSGELQELFEERLRRPMSPASTSQFGAGAERVLNRHRDLDFHVDAEMILYGRTKADAKVMLSGDPIKLRPDGSFTVRLALPDKRQVLPVVASTADGVEQRTIVIAVERNTKVLEPMHREQNE